MSYSLLLRGHYYTIRSLLGKRTFFPFYLVDAMAEISQARNTEAGNPDLPEKI